MFRRIKPQKLPKSEGIGDCLTGYASRVISLIAPSHTIGAGRAGFFLSEFLSASREVIGTPPDAAVTWDCPVVILLLLYFLSL